MSSINFPSSPTLDQTFSVGDKTYKWNGTFWVGASTPELKTVNGQTLIGSGNIEISGGLLSFNTRTGAITLVSNDVTAALGFTPYNSTNPSGYITSSALAPYLTSATASSTYLPLSGGTLTGGLTVGGNVALTPNSGSNRVIGFGSGANTTLVLQAGAASGSGANMELTYDKFAYVDADETRLRSNDAATVFATINSAGLNVNTGALKQGGNQVLHAGNYTGYSPSLTGSGASGTWDISITGTATLSDSGVSAGTYTNATVTVDAKGRVTAASSGSGGGSFLPLSGGTLTGNLGLGVTPAAWDTFTPVLELPGGASLLGVTGQTVLSNNFYYGGGASKRIATGGATQIAFGGEGSFFFMGSASGAANSAITWTTLMSINSVGDVSTYGALKQGNNQVLHAGNYFNYAFPLSGGTLGGTLTIANSDPVLVIKDTNNSGSGAGQFGKLAFQDASGTEYGKIGFTDTAYTSLDISNSKGDVTIQGFKAMTVGNYSSTAASINGYNATGTWPISVTGSAASASEAYAVNVTSPISSTTAHRIGFYNGTSGMLNTMVSSGLTYTPNGSLLTIGGASALTSSNYSSYALPLGGGTITGTVRFTGAQPLVYTPAPTALSTSTTLTTANLLPGIITTASAITLTMPTRTTLLTLVTWSTTSLGFDFSIINTSAGVTALAVNTGVTFVGSASVAAGTSARFRIRYVSTNTFVVYRLS